MTATDHKRLALAAGAALALAAAGVAHAASEAELQAIWRAAIAHTPAPKDGCFTAAYPTVKWTPTACTVAPNIPFVPRHGAAGWTNSNGAGNGNDYAAEVSGLIAQGDGSFPKVTGVRSETDGGRNVYSIQLNSQFFASPACSGSSNPANCLGWEQFVYSSSSRAGFMQYWLINYKATCPAGGWMAYSGDCYRNSAAVSIPQEPITQLANLNLSGAAVAGGRDTLTFTTATRAYSTTGADTVVTLAKYWNGAEFNVIGDGGGSEARFNTGSSVTINIALQDGSTNAPTCKPHAGTTGETNNLTLGKCTTAGGSNSLGDVQRIELAAAGVGRPGDRFDGRDGGARRLGVNANSLG